MKCNTKSSAKQLSLTNPAQNQQLCEYTIRAYNTRVCQVNEANRQSECESEK